MAQIEKLEAQVDVKSSPESFYQAFVRQHYLLPKLSPNVLKDLQLISGEWDSIGSVRQYSYVPTGNLSSHIETVRVETIDEKNKTISCTVLDGSESLKYYKTCNFSVQALGKSEGGGSSVKTTIEYEKRNDDVPPPNKYTEFAEILLKNLDAYLITNNA